jgi:AraC-like DNA-binding protein
VDDALSTLMHDVRPRGAVFSRSVARPPWALRFADAAPLTLVTMIGGEAWLTPAGSAPIPLRPHDVALVKGPAPFVVSDGPATAAGSAVPAFGAEPYAARTALLTSAYDVRGTVPDRVLTVLPAVVVVPVAGPATEIVRRELTRDRPGRQAVVDRALDLLLVETVRRWFDHADDAPAWYRAYADPVIGQALRLIDDNPAHAWSVAELASKVGLSRATFAKRFAELVGQPPMTYVTEWRLCIAADLLGRTDATVDAIARRVGYANAYALSVAFKRVYGTRPSEHRAAARG